MRYRILNGVVIFVAGLLAACSFSTLRSIQRAPEFRSQSVRRVLVIGHFENQTLRKSFEEEFVKQWARRGVRAVASVEALPAGTPLTKEAVAPIAKTQGFDAVLVSRLVERKTIQPGETAIPSMTPPAGQGPQNGNTLWQVLLAPAVSTSQFTLATVQTSLYDVATERQLWSGWTETEVIAKIPKLIPPFVKLILKHLYEIP